MKVQAHLEFLLVNICKDINEGKKLWDIDWIDGPALSSPKRINHDWLNQLNPVGNSLSKIVFHNVLHQRFTLHQNNDVLRCKQLQDYGTSTDKDVSFADNCST